MDEDKVYYCGDSISLEFELYRDIKKTIPWDLSGYEIRFELSLDGVCLRKATSNVSGGNDNQIKIDTNTSNKFIVNFLSDETKDLKAELYLFEIEITNRDNNEVTTVTQSKIQFLQDKIQWKSITD